MKWSELGGRVWVTERKSGTAALKEVQWNSHSLAVGYVLFLPKSTSQKRVNLRNTASADDQEGQ